MSFPGITLSAVVLTRAAFELNPDFKNWSSLPATWPKMRVKDEVLTTGEQLVAGYSQQLEFTMRFIESATTTSLLTGVDVPYRLDLSYLINFTMTPRSPLSDEERGLLHEVGLRNVVPYIRHAVSTILNGSVFARTPAVPLITPESIERAT